MVCSESIICIYKVYCYFNDYIELLSDFPVCFLFMCFGVRRSNAVVLRKKTYESSQDSPTNLRPPVIHEARQITKQKKHFNSVSLPAIAGLL